MRGSVGVSCEPYRPMWHFTPERNWMNDPNGLVHVDGRYHLFFQYNPEGPDWGNMSWGHATSPDLVTWAEHPVALSYREGEQIFSGSVVVDHEDTSGSGDGTTAPLVAVYTSVYPDGRQAQSLAVSVDSGETWHPYAGNPVLDRGSHAFRDPKVFRAADRDGRVRWVMVAVEAELRQVLVYSSVDLREWSHESTIGPFGPGGVVWECPDLFPLDVDGDPTRRRWVLLLSINPVGEDADPDGSSMAYLVGAFDGHRFTPDDPEGPGGAQGWERLDHGRDFYAGVTFDNAPDGRRIMLGWMSNWRYAADIPTAPWRGAMSLPRELALRSVDGQVRLVQSLPRELSALDATGGETLLDGAPLDGRRPLRFGRHVMLDLEWEPRGAARIGVDLLVGDGTATRLSYDLASGQLSLDRSNSGHIDVAPDFPSSSRAQVPMRDGRLRLRVVVDGCLVEVFADDGVVTVSDQVFADPDAVDGAVFADGPATVWVRRLTVAATDGNRFTP